MFTTFTILLLPFFYLLEDILTPHSPPTPSRDVFCSSPPWSSEVLPPLPAYQNGCFSCPPHGKCRGGKLECEEGYFQVYHECVARSEHTLAGYAMKERLLSELASHAGRRVCGDTSSLGAPLPDLTTRELQEYVRPFHPTPEQQAQFERAWAFAHTWLNAEGVLLQNFRPEKDYQTRLLIVNLDSKQPVRYRARYPTKSFTCRLRESTSAHLTAIIILGTIFSIIAHIILFVRMYAKWYSRSSKVYDEMVHKIREDYFIDYDHGGVITQQPQNIFELKEEFLTSTSSSSSEDVLLDQLIWPRVQRLVYSNPSIELGSHTFQYGPSPSWIWRGAVSRSAVKELERVRNPYAGDTLESVQL